MATPHFLRILSLVLFLGLGAGPALGDEPMRMIRDAEIEETVRLYADPVFEAAGLPSEDIRLHLVRDERLNAFVADGRRIFLNTGLLRRAETPLQVIGVIAHEAGHIASGHLVRLRDELEDRAAQRVAGVLLGMAAATLFQEADAGFAVAAGVGHAAHRGLLRYTRKQESAADQASLAILDRAGISSVGLAEFLDILAKRERLSGVAQDPYLRTHPITRERVEIVGAHAENSEWRDAPLPPGLVERHARMVAKLDGFLTEPERILDRYAPDDPGIAARYARAIALYRTPDLERALAVIDGLIAEVPQDPYFHELRGQMLFENGRLDEALSSYRESSRFAPTSALIRRELGRVAVEIATSDALDEARLHLAEATRIDPEDAGAWHLLGIAHGRAGRHVRADLAFAEAAVLTGDIPRARALAERARDRSPEGSGHRQRAEDLLAQMGS